MKNAIIKIKGVQGLDGEEETIELTTDGRYGYKDGEVMITYDESEMIGVKGVKTILHYKKPNTVTLKRSGALQSKLIIIDKSKSSCRYDTGYGELMLDIVGEEMAADFCENGGMLKMSYRIDTMGKVLSKNRIEITIREV